jgi:hypothetical protein
MHSLVGREGKTSRVERWSGQPSWNAKRWGVSRTTLDARVIVDLETARPLAGAYTVPGCQKLCRLCLLPLVPFGCIIVSKLDAINNSHLAENQNSIIAMLLPLELWIVIFDMVIEEGIIRLNQCDYNTFPYDHVFLSPGQDRYRFYGSYCPLRLVCRSFNALLGTQPHCQLHSSTFPFPTSIRALQITPIDEYLEPVFQQLLADTRRCERLVCLDISYWLARSSGRPSLSDILGAGERGAFPNVQHLILWIFSNRDEQREISFWIRLQRAFPQLVTLSVTDSHGWLNQEGKPDKVVTFERLEILCCGNGIKWSGCHFPRLRHASVYTLWDKSALDVFRASPHLECLLVRSRRAKFSIDVRSFSRLHVLSLPEDRLHEVVPLDCDHRLEHLWLHLANISRNPSLIEEIVKRIPRIIRITMDLSSVTGDRRTERIREFKKMRLDSFGLTLMPINLGDTLLVIE